MLCIAKVEDAAVAAADLYEKLQSGTSTDQQQKRRRIAGDTSKLLCADGLPVLQKRLLQDFRF